MASNTGGRIAVLMTSESLAFAKHNCEVNIDQLRNQTLKMATAMMLDETLDLKDTLLKLEELKQQFTTLLKELDTDHGR